MQYMHVQLLADPHAIRHSYAHPVSLAIGGADTQAVGVPDPIANAAAIGAADQRANTAADCRPKVCHSVR